MGLTIKYYNDTTHAVYNLDSDPTAFAWGNTNASLNAFLYRSDNGTLYMKTGPDAENWTLVGSGGSGGAGLSVVEATATINRELIHDDTLIESDLTIPGNSVAYIDASLTYVKCSWDGNAVQAVASYFATLRNNGVDIANAVYGPSPTWAQTAFLDGAFRLVATITNADPDPIIVPLSIGWNMTVNAGGNTFYAEMFNQGFPNVYIRSLISPQPPL